MYFSGSTEYEETPMKSELVPPQIDLGIAYQAPKREIHRVVLTSSGTLDAGYDSVSVIADHHRGAHGLDDAGFHIYINDTGDIEWGRSLEKAPTFPANSRQNDLVIMLHGLEISLKMPALNTLRALLPVINAIHGNNLSFTGMTKHHARLGIGRDGKLIEPALQAPPV